MAKRPVFLPVIEGPSLFEERFIEFKWSPGFAVSQKIKNVNELHAQAKNEGLESLLEVSSKSDDNFGISLSAFNLRFSHKGYGEISVEGAFQGSKVFEEGGPYPDLYKKSGREIKKDARLKESGRLTKFVFDGQEWPLLPRTAFYDWIYINALIQKGDAAQKILDFNGFTDIEFNPKKSLNCQARSCAVYVSLAKRGMIEDVLKDREKFLSALKEARSSDYGLFD